MNEIVRVHKSRMGQFVGRTARLLKINDIRFGSGSPKTTDTLIQEAAFHLGVKPWEFFFMVAKKEAEK